MLCAAALSLGAALPALAADAGIRIVPCDQPVKSAKRGLCLSHMDARDYMALSPSVSWFYNWHFKDTDGAPPEAKMEFLPMVWGNRPADLDGLKTYLATNKPSRILAINEPNLKGQAFISPEQTAQLYKQIKEIADAYKIPVIGPNMSLGSPTGSSITALDPIEKKEVTYTFMTPFEKAFLSYMGETSVPAVAAHSYGNIGELKWMVGMLHQEFNRPVWVTEFAQWGAPSDEAERDYLIQAVDLFERTPYVEGYAWFKERVGGNPRLSLLEKESGKLTPLGETYVNMPVHDPNVFYRLPGKLQAESFVGSEQAEIGATGDGEGFLEMKLTGLHGWLDYNVAVEKPGNFALKVRFSGNAATSIEVLSGDKVLATAKASQKGWQTAETSITLPAGTQTLRVRTSTTARLNWLEFSKKP